MRIAIFSDSHDNIATLELALEAAYREGITHGFHLGDFCGSAVRERLASSKIAWACVWGNMDVEKTETAGLDISAEDFRVIEIEGRVVLLTHYPDIARVAAHAGGYDAAFHGHTHLADATRIEKTLVANPGELCGQRYGEATFAIYDTDTNGVQHVAVG